jgi:hypothetical protein
MEIKLREYLFVDFDAICKHLRSSWRRRLMKKISVMFACMFAVLSFAMADNLQLVTTRPAGADMVIWSQLGSVGTTFDSPFAATSNDGVVITGNFAAPGQGEVIQQGVNWQGNFNPNDFLIWTATGPGDGPLILSFGKNASEAGAQIQPDFFGNFTAQIQAFGSGGLLGTFTENGVSNSYGDNSAIFVGVQDLTGANITSIEYSLASCAPDCTDFAINQLSLVTGTGTRTPEPVSLLLLGTGLLALAGAAKRRFLS